MTHYSTPTLGQGHPPVYLDETPQVRAAWAASWTLLISNNVEDRQQQAHLFNRRRMESLHFDNPLGRQPLSHHLPNRYELQDYCEELQAGPEEPARRNPQ